MKSSVDPPALENLYPIVEHSLDLLCAIDKAGRFVSVNSAAERILGYTQSELTGIGFFEIIHQDDLPETKAVAMEIMAGKDLINFENRYYRKDASIVDLMWTATWNEKDQMMYCVARDITELKKAREALFKSNERFYYATKATFDTIWEWDLITNQLMWGENYYTLFGYESDSASNHISNWYIRIHPSDCEKVVNSINEVLDSNLENWNQEYRYRKADGSYIWVYDKGIILRDQDGRPVKMIGAMQDVTVRKLYEEKLALNEKRFRSLVQESSDLIAIINVDGDYTYVSPSVQNVLGYNPDFLIGKNAFQFIHPDDIEATVVSLKSICNKNIIVLEPFRFQHASGDWRWIETKLTNQLDNPCIEGIIANSRDITEQQKIQEELRTLAMVAKRTSNAVVLTDAQSKIVWVNEAFLKLYKYKAAAIMGKDPQNILSGPSTNKVEIERINESIVQQVSCSTEIIFYTKQREKKLVELQMQPVFDHKGTLVNYFFIHQDITAKKRLQVKLFREQKEKERNITLAVISAQEKERQEIGKELHDDINQVLTTVKLYLELIQKDQKYVAGLLDKSIGFVSDAINGIRRISHTLSYVSMDDLTLQDALTELIQSVNLAERTTISLSVNIEDHKISRVIKLSVYRIVQEQLNNILKYAHAGEALVELTHSASGVHLKIQDNGVGFEPGKCKTGIGLSNIESRVVAYGGTMKIDSAPNKGCTLLVEFPMADHCYRNTKSNDRLHLSSSGD